jgi:hypothetical protein
MDDFQPWMQGKDRHQAILDEQVILDDGNAAGRLYLLQNPGGFFFKCFHINT